MSPAEPPQTRSSDARRTRGRRILLALVPIAIVVFGYLLLRYYTRPVRIKAIAAAYLQQFSRGRVTVGDASFSLLGGVQLFDVSVEPVGHGVSRRDTDFTNGRPMPSVFSCREAKVTQGLLSTLLGNFRIRSIMA